MSLRVRVSVATLLGSGALVASLALTPLAAAAAGSAEVRSSLPSTVIIEPAPTVAPEEPVDPEPNPVPTTDPTTPEEPAPEPSENPAPVDPQPQPAPAPEDPAAPVEVAPVEEPPVEEDPVDEFVEEEPEQEEVVPVAPTPTITPTPTSTPIPAVNIFAPFYPTSYGVARDSMPLVLAGAAAALVLLAAVVSFVVSRWRLARTRRLLHISNESVTASHQSAARAHSRETPSRLDISQLLGAVRPKAASDGAARAETAMDIQSMLRARAADPSTISAPLQLSLSLETPLKDSLHSTATPRSDVRFGLESLLGEPRPMLGAENTPERMRLTGVFGAQRREAKKEIVVPKEFTLRSSASPAPKTVAGQFELPTSLQR